MKTEKIKIIRTRIQRIIGLQGWTRISGINKMIRTEGKNSKNQDLLISSKDFKKQMRGFQSWSSFNPANLCSDS
jgi:hypothetical protein